MADQSRQYRMTRRAESQQATRRRITESAVALHGTLGPSRTSMSAVADRAGVRRSTLYRHFPDEATLFEACSAHWAASNPPPDITAWAAVAEPERRLALALRELYGYYAGNARMLENMLRDEQTMPLVRERFAAFHQFLVMMRDVLMQGRRVRGAARRRVQAALGHAVEFNTWRSLAVEQGLGEADAAALMCALAESAQRPARTPSRRPAHAPR
jgi:AcrR family transcriptional regulator